MEGTSNVQITCGFLCNSEIYLSSSDVQTISECVYAYICFSDSSNGAGIHNYIACVCY